MKLTKVDRLFISRFNRTGAQFAGVMRRYLPATALRNNEARQARTRILIAAKEAQAQMEATAKAWAHRSIPASAKAAALAAAADLPKRFRVASGASLGVQFGGVNERLVARLLEDAGKKLMTVAGTTETLALRRLRTATLMADKDAQISSALAKGLLEQGDMRALTQKVLAATGLAKEDKVVLVNGAEWDAQYYAEVTARTRTLEAANEGYAQQLQSYGQEYFYVPDHAHVDPKDVCYALQGKVWAFSADNDLGLPTLRSLGRKLCPWHPNCTHTCSPWVVEMQSPGEIQQAIADHADDEELMSQVRN